MVRPTPAHRVNSPRLGNLWKEQLHLGRRLPLMAVVPLPQFRLRLLPSHA